LRRVHSSCLLSSQLVTGRAGAAASILTARPDVIFHLAAVVSGEAEDDLEKGYRVNLDATRMLLDAIRAADQGYRSGDRLPFSVARSDSAVSEARASAGRQKRTRRGKARKRVVDVDRLAC